MLQLWDYGVEGDSFVLVLRRYECSLAQWRAALPPDPALHLRLYLSVFADVLRAVQVLRFHAGLGTAHSMTASHAAVLIEKSHSK